MTQARPNAGNYERAEAWKGMVKIKFKIKRTAQRTIPLHNKFQTPQMTDIFSKNNEQRTEIATPNMQWLGALEGTENGEWDGGWAGKRQQKGLKAKTDQ